MPSKYAIGVRGSARCERKYLEWRAEGGASRLATTTIAIMTASRITRRSRITGSKGPSLEQHFMRFCQQSVVYPLAARPMPGMHQRPEQRIACASAELERHAAPLGFGTSAVSPSDAFRLAPHG